MISVTLCLSVAQSSPSDGPRARLGRLFGLGLAGLLAGFAFDFGGGAEWRIADKQAISLGYKYLHISNAYTTPTNPGVDNNVFYLGFSFLR